MDHTISTTPAWNTRSLEMLEGHQRIQACGRHEHQGEQRTDDEHRPQAPRTGDAFEAEHRIGDDPRFLHQIAEIGGDADKSKYAYAQRSPQNIRENQIVDGNEGV
jgi:Ni/Co efflux regulator RcnB